MSSHTAFNNSSCWLTSKSGKDESSDNWALWALNSSLKSDLKLGEYYRDCVWASTDTEVSSGSKENRIGLWSDSSVSDNTGSEMAKPWVSTRSKIWPWIWVASFIHCTRLKDSMRVKNSFDRVFDGQHTWTLKSPTNKKHILCAH